MNEETIAEDDNGRRLDRVLRKAYPNVPPGAIAGAVRKGAIRVNGKRASNETRVATGDRITIPDWHDSGRENRRTMPRERRVDARRTDNAIVSGEWSIPILERNDDWIVLNKPAGIASHGPTGLDTIVRIVAEQEGWWSNSMSFRPGPVHRLDQETSGVQLFSLSAEGARTLTEQIRERTVSKMYLALVAGYLPRRIENTQRLAYDRDSRTAVTEGVPTVPREKGAPSGHEMRRPRAHHLRYASARTRFFPLTFNADRSVGLVAAVPETGRTHQVRCHAAASGIPLVGDTKYGGPASDDFDSFILHAIFFATHAPAHGWNAPLASHTYGLLRTRFGDLSGLERRLNEIVPTACTGYSGTATIRV